MAGKITVALYLIAAVAFGAYLQLRQPFATVGAATIGGTIGMAGALIVAPGIIPAIIWTIGQFRPKETRSDYKGGALVIWVVLGAAMAALVAAGNSYDRDQKLNAELGGMRREDFVRETTQACAASQKQNPLNRQAGVTDAQIAIYCGCYADALSKTLTLDEIRYYVLNGKPPESTQAKVDQTVPGCTSQALKR